MLVRRCFCTEMWWKLKLPSWVKSVLDSMQLYLLFLIVLSSWTLVALKQQQRSSFKPVTSCLCLISLGLFHLFTLNLLYFHTWQHKRESSLAKSAIIYICTLRILRWAWEFYRPAARCSAHPVRRGWQYVDERKRWLSDLWRSCAHLIIPLK